tara:strand:- start:799 stop:945 length:147 start_codon:yes stop_codon:yes gene_type:complete
MDLLKRPLITIFAQWKKAYVVIIVIVALNALNINVSVLAHVKIVAAII